MDQTWEIMPCRRLRVRARGAAGGDHDRDYWMMATSPMEITQVKRIFVHLPSRRTVRGPQSDFELQDDNYAVCEKNSVDSAPSARYFVFKQDGPG
jgi:hypothetical protein